MENSANNNSSIDQIEFLRSDDWKQFDSLSVAREMGDMSSAWHSLLLSVQFNFVYWRISMHGSHKKIENNYGFVAKEISFVAEILPSTVAGGVWKSKIDNGNVLIYQAFDNQL